MSASLPSCGPGWGEHDISPPLPWDGVMRASTAMSTFSLAPEEFPGHQHLQLVPAGAVTPPDSFYVRKGKRWFDLVAGSLLLLVFAAPMLLVSLVIRLTSHGPVLFVQERVGLHLTSFRCFKFRTMVADAEEILLQNPQLQSAMAVSWKIPDDPRVTRIGSALRKTSMDELPQLFNVILGEMSLVGPRPMQVREIHEMYGDLKFGVTSVRPGMTGLWQVSGRSAVSYAERIALDEMYVTTCNFRQDLMLMVRTLRVLVVPNGAY